MLAQRGRFFALTLREVGSWSSMNWEWENRTNFYSRFCIFNVLHPRGPRSVLSSKMYFKIVLVLSCLPHLNNSHFCGAQTLEFCQAAHRVVKSVRACVHTGIWDQLMKSSGSVCACWEISKLIWYSWKHCCWRRRLIWGKRSFGYTK